MKWPEQELGPQRKSRQSQRETVCMPAVCPQATCELADAVVHLHTSGDLRTRWAVRVGARHARCGGRTALMCKLNSGGRFALSILPLMDVEAFNNWRVESNNSV